MMKAKITELQKAIPFFEIWIKDYVHSHKPHQLTYSEEVILKLGIDLVNTALKKIKESTQYDIDQFIEDTELMDEGTNGE